MDSKTAKTELTQLLVVSLGTSATCPVFLIFAIGIPLPSYNGASPLSLTSLEMSEGFLQRNHVYALDMNFSVLTGKAEESILGIDNNNNNKNNYYLCKDLHTLGTLIPLC